MINLFNLPDNSINNQVFYVSSSGSTSWQIWTKPHNAKFIQLFVLGSGAGGGGGGTGSVTNARGGGGGGGTGAFSTGFFPACVLPDTLYIQVGKGGAGGGAGTIGTSGELTYISVYSPSIATNAILMQSGAAVPTGGGGSTTTSGGAAGVAGTIWDYTLHIFPQLGQIFPVAGQNGATGGASSAVGPNITITLPITGGAGGSGANAAGNWFAGDDITGAGWVNTVSGGKTVGANGSGGYIANFPSSSSSARQHMLFTGGAGGAGQISGIGGFGGNAAFGCGGGGGGGTSTAAAGVGGSGGRGGDGLIIITCW